MRHVSDAIHKCLILKNAQEYNAIYDQDIESCIPYTWEHFKERNKKELVFDEIKKRMNLYKQRTPVNISANGGR